MTRDYKPSAPKQSKGSPFFTGLLIGFLLGVGASVALTMFIKGTDNPFTEKQINRPNQDFSRNTEKKVVEEETAVNEDNTEKNNDSQFDFYTILPETESTVTEQEVKDSSTIKKDNYFLQVGAFQNESDADNMKAKLALLGFEAVVQTATIPEKGIWHRVRVGPLNDIDQINKIRGDLTTNGFNTDLIKVHTESKPN